MSHRIQQLQQHHSYTLQKQIEKQPKTLFKDVLSSKDLKISKHAKQRLSERNIDISEKQWQEISMKMQQAKRKGITDSLVVMKDTTLLVSTKNNTVVTAMDQNEASSKIFTNINGAILINE